jgi:predicted ribosomally synthesized peptide with SipW-like signal peptide
MIVLLASVLAIIGGLSGAAVYAYFTDKPW